MIWHEAVGWNPKTVGFGLCGKLEERFMNQARIAESLRATFSHQSQKVPLGAEILLRRQPNVFSAKLRHAMRLHFVAPAFVAGHLSVAQRRCRPKGRLYAMLRIEA